MSTVFEEEVLKYFENRDNRFENSTGMVFGIAEKRSIWTSCRLSDENDDSLTIDISTEEDSPIGFIEEFQLKTIRDIDNLGYYNSWMRYLNGNAVISVTPMELEASLGFRIVKQKTIVFSIELHFYDEVYEHLTMPEDFVGYISNKTRMLNRAAENRYKWK
jgi:hypothetical protein